MPSASSKPSSASAVAQRRTQTRQPKSQPASSSNVKSSTPKQSRLFLSLFYFLLFFIQFLITIAPIAAGFYYNFPFSLCIPVTLIIASPIFGLSAGYLTCGIIIGGFIALSYPIMMVDKFVGNEV